MVSVALVKLLLGQSEQFNIKMTELLYDPQLLRNIQSVNCYSHFVDALI